MLLLASILVVLVCSTEQVNITIGKPHMTLFKLFTGTLWLGLGEGWHQIKNVKYQCT